ncbi:MAG: thioredoxin domain-containing protein [Pseudomonadota bacterium]
MKKAVILIAIAVAIAGYYWINYHDSTAVAPVPGAAAATPAPVKGMVTLVDLGADKCVPCKMMAPILVELEKEYQGRAAIVVLDVWKDPAPAKRFGIRAIPTQIFFDETGKEVYRHVGFLSKEAIVSQLKSLGVK